jgi:hypothetical protein
LAGVILLRIAAAALFVCLPLASAQPDEPSGLTVFEFFDRFTVARAATEICDPGHRFAERFWVNDSAARRLATRRVMEARPDLSRDDVEATLEGRMQTLAKRTRELVTARGCSDEDTASLIRLQRLLEEVDFSAPG